MRGDVIVPTEVPAETWRNGRGARRVLLHTPEWRISLAEIDGEMPFSVFPGLDRLLAPITDPGLTLRIDGVPVEVAAREAVRFCGEDAVVGDASAQPVTVVNVMSTRSAARVGHAIETGPLGDGPADAAVILRGRVALGRRALRPGSVLLPGALAEAIVAPDAVLLRLWLRPPPVR
ncbi:HutD family protein [Microbacterium sp.]|uniref:HutD family protein n=1 Tax=Microbacterium sp. TaxID=51671 RepID=UPI00289CDEBA|nr:HutD family protein [Microbacterium sp.]